MPRLLSLPLLLALACGGASDDAPSDDSTAGDDSTPAGDDSGPGDGPLSPGDLGVPGPGALTVDERMIRWPYYSSVTTTSAVIHFGFVPGSTGDDAVVVEWGPSADLGNTAPSSVAQLDTMVTPIELHVVELDGLQANTRYAYRVKVGDAYVTDMLSFQTAPPNDGSVATTFLVTGDFGGGGEPAQDVLDVIMKHTDEIDIWLTTGDNAYNSGTYDEWQTNIFAFYRDLLRMVPFYPAPGNHDYGNLFGLQPTFDNFVLPDDALTDEDKERYYSFDWGAVRTLVGDSQLAVDRPTPEPGDDMIDWFEQVLTSDETQARPWRWAVWHHPVYMTTPGRTAKISVLLNLVPLIEANGVQLNLTGHNHVYERFSHMQDREKLETGGTTYIVTGAGGKSLYEIRDDSEGDVGDLPLRDFGLADYHFLLIDVDRCTLTVRAIDTSDTVIDTWETTRCEE